MTLGERLRAAIDARKLSHAWVAEEVGMTAASLSSILTGKTTDPSFFTVLAIARVIGEPISALVDDPLHIWTNEELGRLIESGRWLYERATRERAGRPLDIPPRKKARPVRAQVHPVAASAGGVVYPDAFELPQKRIPARYSRMNADSVFSVRGDSMTGEAIFPGDLLYVRRTPQIDAAIGKIVVCVVEDMLLVKRLATRGEQLVLASAHPDHPPMMVDENSSRFHLIGIVVGTSRT
jgi:SOS-response transcriptional repressor LexA